MKTPTHILNIDPGFRPLVRPNYHPITCEMVDDTALLQFQGTLNQVIITHRINTGRDMHCLMRVVAAINGLGCYNIELIVPCFPESRLPCTDPEEILSAENFVEIINALDLTHVTLLSAGMAPSINNLHPLDHDHRHVFDSVRNLKARNVNVVSPDQAFEARVQRVTEYLRKKDPTRHYHQVTVDRTSGSPRTRDLKGYPTIVIDDFIARGRFHFQLASALRQSNSGALALYATHATSQEGLDTLTQAYDKVITTNSRGDFKSSKKLSVVKLEL